MVKLLDVSSDMQNALWGIHGKIPGDFFFENQNVLYQASILTASSLLVVVPLIVLYMFVQKRFVESASNAGIVG